MVRQLFTIVALTLFSASVFAKPAASKHEAVTPKKTGATEAVSGDSTFETCTSHGMKGLGSSKTRLTCQNPDRSIHLICDAEIGQGTYKGAEFASGQLKLGSLGASFSCQDLSQSTVTASMSKR